MDYSTATFVRESTGVLTPTVPERREDTSMDVEVKDDDALVTHLPNKPKSMLLVGLLAGATLVLKSNLQQAVVIVFSIRWVGSWLI